MTEPRSWSGQIEALDLRVHGLIHGLEKLLEHQIKALDDRVVLHIEAVEKWARGELLSQDRRMQDMEKYATRAVDKAQECVTRADSAKNEALEKYKETANEMRASLSDQRKDMMPRMEIETRFASINSAVANLKMSRDEAGGRILGGAPFMQIGMLIAAGIISAIVALLVK
jgi:hypothetical protein